MSPNVTGSAGKTYALWPSAFTRQNPPADLITRPRFAPPLVAEFWESQFGQSSRKFETLLSELTPLMCSKISGKRFPFHSRGLWKNVHRGLSQRSGIGGLLLRSPTQVVRSGGAVTSRTGCM